MHLNINKKEKTIMLMKNKNETRQPEVCNYVGKKKKKRRWLIKYSFN